MDEQIPLAVIWPQSSGKREKAILVGVQLPRIEREYVLDSLEELEELAKTAGAEVIEKIIAKRDSPAPNFYVGEGKAAEIKDICVAEKIDAVIFDNELAPAQVRNLQELLNVKVIDRTELILDIFALHAKSREGKLQVELAQLKYMLPRLVHAWTHLSRQWGGMGTRGPGEKQLEIDRRRIKERISKLKEDLARVHSNRKIQRKHRERAGVPLIAVMGYTNAGKTTLFNRLTGMSLPAENKLFTTLDPKLKRLTFPDRQVFLVSDTVGFIRKLPHDLIESFKATLEEVFEADILLHVVDGNSENVYEHYDIVVKLLKELGVADKSVITIINKSDLFLDDYVQVRKLQNLLGGGIVLSAKTGEGLPDLLVELKQELERLREEIEFFIPTEKLGMVSKLYGAGNVKSIRYTDKGASIKVLMQRCSIGEFKDWVVK